VLVVLGVLLVVVAGTGAVLTLRTWPLWTVLRRVRPTTPERLAVAARDGHLDGRVVAVAGMATAAASGALRSAVNHEPCVWHRHVVHRRHVRYRSTPRGTVQRYSLRRRVADVASTQPFLLRGVPAQSSPSGGRSPAAVEVAPAGMRVHRPLAQGLRILPGLASEPFPASDTIIGRVAQLYWHREWVLRPGTRIFVLGQLRSDGQRLSLQRPGQGPHVVSTRTAAWLRRSTAVSAFGGLLLATLGGLAGATLLIVHFV
jgi:hypothetical protein